MADVVLVQPRLGEWDRFVKYSSLPIALLSAVRLVDKEFAVKFIDQRTEKDWKIKLKGELDKNPICVGLTSCTGPQIKYVLQISRFVKRNSNIPIVLGGIHASLLPKQTLENKYIDFVVRGDGENTFLELVKRINSNGSFKGIRGLWYKENGVIKSNENPDYVDLNSLPGLPYDLVKVSDYIKEDNGYKTIDVVTSRGCPRNCLFCHNTSKNYNSPWRGRSSEKIIKELKYLKDEFNINSFVIFEDASFVDVIRIKNLAIGLIKEDLQLKWTINGVHINDFKRIDDDLLAILYKSGCTTINCGVESGSNKVLRLINKRITVRDVINTNKRLSHFRFNIGYTFMSGFPGETKKDLKKTIDLIFRLKKDNINAKIGSISCYVPFPGTKLYEISKELGFLEPASLEGYSKYDWGMNHSNVNLPWLKESKKRILGMIYFTSSFIDPKYVSENFSNSTIIKILSHIYAPFARYRIKNMEFKIPLEIHFARIINGINNRL